MNGISEGGTITGLHIEFSKASDLAGAVHIDYSGNPIIHWVAPGWETNVRADSHYQSYIQWYHSIPGVSPQ